MTRARDSEEVGGVEEEKTTNIVSSWDSPNLSEDLVDRIYDMVRGWLTDREPAASDFFYYCRIAATSVIILRKLTRSGYGCST